MFLNALFFLVSSVSTDYCNPPSVHYSEGFCLLPGGIDDFYNAQMRCINSGGFLPSVVDDRANDIMFQQMQERDSCTGSWIGMDRRMVWTDGANLTYTNWDSKDQENVTITECVQMLKSNGSWAESACTTRMGFFCIIPADPHAPTTTPSPPCQPYNTDLPTPIANKQCKVGEHCSGHWRIVAIVAATTNSSYVSALNFMNDMTSSCESNDQLLFLSPGKLASDQSDCEIDKASSNYFTSLSTKYEFSDDDQTATGDVVETLLETAYSCLDENRKENKRGGVVYLMTDMPCSTLCTPSLNYNQSSLLNNIISLGYIVRIIKLTNSTSDCTSNVFAQCAQWDDECGVTSINSVSVGGLCKPYIMPAWLIGTIVALVVVLIIIIVAAIVFRYYLKRHGGWQRFWKHMAQQRSNSYSDEPKKIYDEWEIRPENLEIYLERELGSGAFGVVYEGHLSGKRPVDDIIQSAKLTSSAFTGKVAVKRVPPHADLLAKRDFEDEVQFMKKLGFHTHILGMNGCLLSADLPLMVLELCEHGDLLGFVRNHKNTFKTDGTGSIRPKDLISISWQISDGLCYLKSLEMIHRDLAARNILITKDLVAKISDFGLCRQAATTDSSSIYISRGGRLPVKWMAPESLKNYHFSFKTDVWSFGIVLWETFTLGGVPFPDVNATAMLEELESGSRPENTEIIPESMYKLMNKCWAENPEDRCDVEDVKDELTDLLNADANYYGYVAVSCVAQFDDNDRTVMEELEEIETANSLQSLETATDSNQSEEEQSNKFSEVVDVLEIQSKNSSFSSGEF